MTKVPIQAENTEKNWHNKNTIENFDNTAIADRLRTVSWSNNSRSDSEVKPVYAYPTFPLPAKAMLSKEHTFENF